MFMTCACLIHVVSIDFWQDRVEVEVEVKTFNTLFGFNMREQKS